MSEMTFDLTPNYKGVFNHMLREAQALAVVFWADQPYDAANAQALRRLQKWFAPLTVAAQAMTTAEEVQRLRHLMAEILADLDRLAGEMEMRATEDEEWKREVAEKWGSNPSIS